jgi:hypothetical protein
MYLVLVFFFPHPRHLVPFDLAHLKRTSTTMEHIYSSQEPRFELPEDLQCKFGFSETFKVFSDEGLSVASTILKRENERGFVLPDVRIQLCLRGVSYRSSFLRGFSESHELKNLACGLTGESLVMHPMISNQAHINWGVPCGESEKVVAVDQWHKDSVSHVLIVLMTDMTDAVGGELEFIMRPTGEAFRLLKETGNKVSEV